jgi:regulator of protease activity HflC (stomatin/prohibitin superfamily)
MRDYDYNDASNGPDFEKMLRQLRDRLRPNLRKVFIIAAGAVVIIWLASGIYTVGPGHVGVVRTFGKEGARSEPGLHYRIPWPVQKVDVVSTEQIRRIEVGFQGARRIAEESSMLTGDENIVEALMVVQYRVADPSKYLFRLHDPDAALHAATQVALPREVQASVFARMQAEREREAKRYRSEGEEEAAKLRAQTDKERTIVLATAEQQAQKLRGQGDAQATHIYAAAYGKDPEFYRFVRSLQSYEQFLGKRSTLLLSADAPLFRYLRGPQADQPGAEKTTNSTSAPVAAASRARKNP